MCVFVLHPNPACAEGGVSDRPEFRRGAGFERLWFCLGGFRGGCRAARLGLGLILRNAEHRDQEEEPKGRGDYDYEIGIPSSHRQPISLREYLPIGYGFCQVSGAGSCRQVRVTVAPRRVGQSRMNGLRKSSFVVFSTTWVLVLSTCGRARTSFAKLLSSSLFLNFEMTMLSSSPVTS